MDEEFINLAPRRATEEKSVSVGGGHVRGTREGASVVGWGGAGGQLGPDENPCDALRRERAILGERA